MGKEPYSEVNGLMERDESAVKVAEALWPQRYVGDLTRAEWVRCYEIVDAARATKA